MRNEWRSRYISLAACAAFCALYPMSFACTGLFLVELAPYFNTGKKSITWIAAFQSGLGGCFGVVAGLLIRRFGARAVGIFATTMTVAGLLTSAFISNLYVLYVSFGIVFGMGSITFVTIGFTAGVRHFHRHKALVAGLMATCISVGAFALAPLVEFLIEVFAWKGAMVVLAGLHMHGYVFSLLLAPAPTLVGVEGRLCQEPTEESHNRLLPTKESLPEKTLDMQIISRREEKESKEKAQEGSSRYAVQYVSVGRYWKCTFSVFLVCSTLEAVCHMNFYTYIPMLNAQMGLSRQRGAFLMSIMNICSATVRLPAGLVGNQKRASCTLLFSVSIAAAGVLSMCSVLCRTYTALLTLCALFGIAGGIYMSLQNPSLLDNASLEHVEICTGLMTTLHGVAVFVMHSTAGFLLDAIGDTNILFFIFGAAGCIAGMLGLCLLLPALCKRCGS